MLVFCDHEGSCRAGPMMPIWVCEAARRGLTDHDRPLLVAELALIERAPRHILWSVREHVLRSVAVRPSKPAMRVLSNATRS